MVNLYCNIVEKSWLLLTHDTIQNQNKWSELLVCKVQVLVKLNTIKIKLNHLCYLKSQLIYLFKVILR